MWRSPGTAPLPGSQRDPQALPLSSKKMYVALGGAGGEVTRRDPGESGVGPKQTDFGAAAAAAAAAAGRVKTLSQTPSTSIITRQHYVA